MAASDFDIGRLQALDDGEWGRLRSDYHDRIFGYVRRQIDDADRAEDLVQDVFLGAIRGIGGFDRKYNVEQYLMGIARNKIIDQLRRRRPEYTMGSDPDDSVSFFDRVASDVPASSQIHAARETVNRQRTALIEALRALVTDLRVKGEYAKLMAIELTFLTDWKHRRIAELLGVADEKSIAGIKFRAIRDLQTRLRARDPHRTLFTGLWRSL